VIIFLPYKVSYRANVATSSGILLNSVLSGSKDSGMMVKNTNMPVFVGYLKLRSSIFGINPERYND
jgi:hypothetical protein